MRYDHNQRRVFVTSITNGSMSVLTWNGQEVQDFQFDVRKIVGDPLAEGQVNKGTEEMITLKFSGQIKKILCFRI